MNDTEQTIWRGDSDELAIRNLIAKIAHLADDGDLDEYMSCFADDAVWGGGGQPMREGSKAILYGAQDRRAKGLSGPGTYSRHVIATTWIEMDGGAALARSVFHFYININTEPKLVALGVYKDTFTKLDGKWLLQRRELEGSAADLPVAK